MTASLSGVRIWLSGSVPEGASDAESQRIQAFVKLLALEVFKQGGTIAHGCHPTFLAPLRQAVDEYQAATNGSKAPLALFVSRWFIEPLVENAPDIAAWNDVCDEPVEVTPKAATGASQKSEELRSISLSIMRQTMSARCNAIVAIGGRWWNVARDKAGVSEEIDLAAASQLPLFLIGGFGGTVAGLLSDRPELLRNCANGLSKQQNESLAAESDANAAVRTVVDQLQRLPLRAIAGRDETPFRILCLDGGGIRGAYTASVLAYWEKALNLHQTGGQRLVDHFDMIAGTSTGGILAIGLALGMSAQDMLKFYVDRGEHIFGTGEGLNKWWHSFRHWFTSKFDQANLQAELETAFKSSPVGGSVPRAEWLDNPPCKLLIPAYNTLIDQPYLFRSPYGRFQYTDKGHDAVNVALSSAAAPTYFKPVTINRPGAPVQAVDGGVWANSPVSIAIAEATGELQIPIKNIRVLSIGTTHTTQLTGEPMKLNGSVIGKLLKTVIPGPIGWVSSKLAAAAWKPVSVNGLVGWVGNIAGLLMKTQAQTSDIMGQQLLGDRYLRIDSESPYGELDDVTRIAHFSSLGNSAAQHPATFARVQSLFLG